MPMLEDYLKQPSFTDDEAKANNRLTALDRAIAVTAQRTLNSKEIIEISKLFEAYLNGDEEPKYILSAYLDSGLSIRLSTNGVPNDEKKFVYAFDDFLSSVKDAVPASNTAEVQA